MEIILRTKRLVLRPLAVYDTNIVHEYASDIETTRYMIRLPNKTLAETVAFLTAVQREWEKDEPAFFEFAITKDNVQVGAIGLYPDGDTAEIGWIISKRHQGFGYCTEAAHAVIDFARSRGIKTLISRCDTKNASSRHVMEKLGMTLAGEGTRVYPDDRGNASEYEYRLSLCEEQ